MRQAYSIELDLRAKTDYNSTKKLLEQTDDFGNILFLFQQSYEKILKSVFVYCECVVFNRDFKELLKDKKIKRTHSHTVEAELIQTILPRLLRNYKKTVEILDEKLAKNKQQITICPYCNSNIGKWARTCPSCRNTLTF